MNEPAMIRYLGANVRESVAARYVNHGPDFGYKLACRVVGEMAAQVAESHCREDAVEMLYRAGDRIAAGLPLGAPLMPDEELLPGPRAKLAEITAAPEPAAPPPEPPPPKSWPRRLWDDVKLHWSSTLAGFLLGVVVAGPR